jgi:NAD(P)H-nitrite reductase large subunit
VVLYRPVDFYGKNNIQTFLGKKVERLRLDEHTAEFGNGERVAWGKLLLATGGVPIVPSIKGVDGSRVFTFTTLDDAV